MDRVTLRAYGQELLLGDAVDLNEGLFARRCLAFEVMPLKISVSELFDQKNPQFNAPEVQEGSIICSRSKHSILERVFAGSNSYSAAQSM